MSSFVEIPLDDVHEDKIVPEGEYELVASEVREIKDDESQKITAYVVPLLIQDPPKGIAPEDVGEVSLWLNLPAADDEPRDKKYKILNIKRFLHHFGVAQSGNGFNPQDVPGSKARCLVKQQVGKKDGVTRNIVVLPKIAGE